MKELISIIVPVYKVEEYLSDCVDSILAQTYWHLEVILVDDGSPDGCGAICDRYAQRDSRVKVIHKTNGGLSDARNAGMAVATGGWLMFVDSDDLLPEDSVQVMLDLAIQEDAELVIGGHDRFEDGPVWADPDGQADVHVMTKEDAFLDMFHNGCAAWARLYRRQIHEGILFPVGEINEDEAIVLSILENCQRVAKTNAVVYHYRCRAESITTTQFSRKKLHWAKHCADNLRYVREHYPAMEEGAAMRYRSCLLWSLTEIALSDEDFSTDIASLREMLWRERKIFRRTSLPSLQDRVRMFLLMYMPFCIYRGLIRLKRGS